MLLLSHLLGMHHVPHVHLAATSPQDDGASLAPYALQYSSSSLIPNSNLDYSPAFRGQFPSIFADEESSEDVPTSKGSLGLGSASTLEEASNSKHGQEGKRKLRRTRGVGERGINKSGHTVYKGVRKRKGNRWVSEIREPGKKTSIWLGTFSTLEMAAIAYDVAAFNLKTPYAYLNFPEYVSSLPILTSRSPKHVQEAAVTAALGVASCSSRHMGRMGGLVPTPKVDESSMSFSTKQQKQSTTMETRASSFDDEDLIFDMPNVLADMVQGLLIAPPLHYLDTFTNTDSNIDCVPNEECPLWKL